MNEETLLP